MGRNENRPIGSRLANFTTGCLHQMPRVPSIGSSRQYEGSPPLLPLSSGNPKPVAQDTHLSPRLREGVLFFVRSNFGRSFDGLFGLESVLRGRHDVTLPRTYVN